MQLGQGAGQRGIDCCDFFVRELFSQPGFGPLPRFFGFRLVNAVGRDSQIRQHGHASRR